MGNGESREVKELREEREKNSNLRKEINSVKTELKAVLHRLEESARRNETDYNEIRAFINGLGLSMPQEERFALLGSKGVGKSTLLRVLGVDAFTSSSSVDGTSKTTVYGSMIDTVGINIELSLLFKWTAVTLMDSGLPTTLLLVCNERFNRPLTILQQLFIDEIYLAIPRPARIYNDEYELDISKNHLERKRTKYGILETDEEMLKRCNRQAFNVDAYDEMVRNYGTKKITPVKFETNLIHKDSFRSLKNILFKEDKLYMMSYEEFVGTDSKDYGIKDRGVDMGKIISFEIFRCIYWYQKNYKGHPADYLNEIPK